MVTSSGNIKYFWIVVLFLIMFTPFTMAQTLAQTPHIQAVQSTSVDYGTSLTFEVQATADTTLTGTHLTVQIANRNNTYREAVSLFPGTTVMASHTMTVDALQLPPFAQIVYFWDFQDESGGTYRTDQQVIYYEDTYIPWKWVRTNQGHITINTDGRDQLVANSALEIATRSMAQQSQLLGLAQPPDITLYIYPELTQLAAALRLHHQHIQDWVAAYSIPDQHIILIASTSGPEMLPNMQRDLPHQITHLVVYDIAGEAAHQVPGWFNEGLALSSGSPEPDSTFKDALNEAVHKGVLLSLETLCIGDFSNLPPRDATLAYAQSDSVVRYITKRYGASQIQALMAAYADGFSCSGAVDRALGISLSTLETQWHSELGRTVTSSRQNMTLAPWILAWVVSLALALLFVAPQPRPAEEHSVFDTKAAISSLPDKTAGTGTDREQP
ncbi:MAG: hypothetical protein JXB07_05760 [Anaerolineae bacterium]|nr:hypothetical protein [Anaerolineae bacterium]